MSFIRQTVESALVAFAREATGVEWVLANQGVDRPARPYGTLLVSAVDGLGWGDVEEEEASGIQITERLREMFVVDVSVQTFGTNAADMLSAMRTHVRRPSVRVGTYQVIRLGYMSTSEIRDFAQEVSARWEGRAQMDMRFSVRFDSNLDLDTIAQVEISGAGGTQTVEVP